MNFKFKIRTTIAMLLICSSIQSQEIHTRAEVDTLLVRAYNYIMADSILQAFNTINKSLEIATKNNYREQEASCYNHLSGLYIRIQPNMETSVNYLKKSLSIYQELGLKERVDVMYTNMLYIYYKLNRQKKFDSISKIVTKLQTENQISLFYLSEYLVLNAHDNTKNFQLIDSITRDKIKLIETYKFTTTEEKTNEKYIKNNMLYTMKIYRGVALIALNKNAEEANKLFNEVLAIDLENQLFNTTRFQRKIIELYTAKQKYFSNFKKNKDSLIKYYKKKDSLRSIILAAEEILNLKNYRYVSKNLKQQEEMKSLQLLHKKNDKLRKLSSLTIILIFNALLISTFFVLYFRKANKRITKSLNGKKEIELKLGNIQKAIASDLHDNFGNRISGILSSSEIVKELINQKQTKTTYFVKYLNNLNQGVGNLLFDLKDLIWSYEVNNDAVVKLSDRMQHYANEFANNYAIKILYNHTIYNEAVVLPHLWNRQILLTYKEAINNAYKHAQTDVIETYLSLNASNIIEVKIIDNGIGFSQENKKLSGVSNMKKRAESIGCKLHINTMNGKGTEIILIGKIPPNIT